MQTNIRKTVILLIIVVSFLLLSGCTNWKKKYENLNVAYKNLEGRLEYEKQQKGMLTEQVTQGQQTIEELQRKIAEQNKTAGEVTAFGKDYDVRLDAAAGTITVTLPNAILFAPGRASLIKRTSAELDHIHSVLQREYRSRHIDVVGHTDSDPIKKSKWKDNWELSAQRALTVVRYLTKRGIDRDRIRAVGCGEARPVASNSTSSGKSRNRRVEIVVHMR